MKKVIVDIIIVIMGFIMSDFILKAFLNILDNYNIIGDNGRLIVLSFPFIIYGFVLFVLVPYIIKFINKKL